jgi:protein transport protein SEC31
MGIVAEVGRLACCAWAPSGSHVAAGTYAGAVDTSFEATSSFELLQLDVSNARVVPSSPIRLPEKFASIAWGRITRNHPAGLIAGGLNDGTVRVWDAATLLRPATDAAARDPNRALLMPPSTAAKHTGPVNSVSFNHVVGHMFATGGADGQVLLWDMTNPSAPSVRPPGAAEATSKDEIIGVAWNPKIGHILGTGSSSGVVSVWDVQNRKQVINIRNPRGRLRASSLVWHPAIPTQLLVACDEDDGTGAQLWDLRNATAPLVSLTHHAPRGIMSATWCPHDADLVLTTSRDGRSTLVSPTTGMVIAELPKSSAWNFDVQWSPRSAGVYLSSSFDGRVSFNSILTANAAPSVSAETANALRESFGADVGDFQSGMAVQSPRTLVAERESVTMSQPPKWLRRPAAVSFGFGGRVVSVSSKSGGAVTISGAADRNPALGESLTAMDALLAAASPDDPAPLADLCTQSAAEAANAAERAAWEVLSMQFQTDSRRKMLKHLGFSAAPPTVGDMSDQVFGMEHSPALANPVRPVDAEKIDATADGGAALDSGSAMSVLNGTVHAVGTLSLDGPAPWDAQDSGSLLDGPPSQAENGDGPADAAAAEAATDAPEGKAELSGLDKAGIDAVVKKAIIVGDFELAVDACMRAGRAADALVIAHAGGPALWHQAQAEYLATSTAQEGGDAVIGAAIGAKNKMDEFIITAASGSKESWREALALILAYVDGEEFAGSCSALGQRLLDKENYGAALTCFVCACNTRMVTSVWLRGRPASGNLAAAIASRSDRLVALVAKVRMITAAASLARGERDIGAIRAWDDVSAGVLFEYGAMLAAQGHVATAVLYLNPLDPSVAGVRGVVEDVQAQANESLAIQQLERGATATPVTTDYRGAHTAPQRQPQAYDPFSAPKRSGFAAAPVPQSVLPSSQPMHDAMHPTPMAPQQQYGPGGYSGPPQMLPPAVPSMPSSPSPLRPGSVFGTSGVVGMSPVAGPRQGGAYTKTFYPNQAVSPHAHPPVAPEAPAQNGYTVMAPAAPVAPPIVQMPAMPAPPPPPMMGGDMGGGFAGLPGPNATSATNGHAPVAPMPPAMPAAMPMMPAMQVMPSVPPQPGMRPSAPMQMHGSHAGIPSPYGGHVAMPPPPPPPPVSADEPPPMSYHTKATLGAGANLPPSSEVAVAKQRQKPASSSGVPGGVPRRSPSTSSSLSSMAAESTLPLDKVDVRNVPGDQLVIVKSLRGAFQYAMGRNSTMMYKKKMDDVSKKLGRLLSQLNAKEIDPGIVAQLGVLATGISKGDYETAKRVTASFNKSVDWESNRYWIQALNRLIDAVLNGR